MDAFVNYYILQEFLSVNDAFTNSTYFYRNVRGKLHIGPVWDYNNTLDNFLRSVPMDEFLLSQRGWFAALMSDETFVEQVISRYRYLRETLLSDAYLENYVDETIAWLGDAIERNYAVWGYAFDVNQVEKSEYRQPAIGESFASSEEYMAAIDLLNPDNFEEAIAMMCTTMLERGDWLDDNIESLRQYCAESKYANRVLN